MVFCSNVIEGKRARFWNERDSSPGDPVRCNVEQVDAVEGQSTTRRIVDAAHDVEHRRLACAVGADQTEDLTLLDLERQPVESHDAAEPDRDLVDFQ